MKLSRFTALILFFGVVLLAVPPTVVAEDEDANEDGNDQQEEEEEEQQQDDAGDDNANAQQNYGGNDDWNSVEAEYAGDDYIKYWTGYAILPKTCIKLGGQDVVVFSVFENGYKQCSDKPMGTYYTPVPYFLQAYLAQIMTNQQDMGYEDYELPESSQYAECTYKAVNGEAYYVMAGCDDSNKHQLAVNIYQDETCEKPSSVDGMDDSNIDISDIQIPFQKCQACVAWVDKNDDEVDDQYYEDKQVNAPLCSKVWALKSKCGARCKRKSKERTAADMWQRADIVLLTTLSIFAAGMLAAVIKKRHKIEEKEGSLLADPTVVSKKSAIRWIPEKQLYMGVGGAFFLFVVFALFTAKKMAWFIIICLNLALFGYLLKLVMEHMEVSGDDEDDEDDDDEEEDEDSEKPQLTNLPAFT